MTQIDGATTSNDDRLLIMGATNIPWELDEAVLRWRMFFENAYFRFMICLLTCRKRFSKNWLFPFPSSLVLRVMIITIIITRHALWRCLYCVILLSSRLLSLRLRIKSSLTLSDFITYLYYTQCRRLVKRIYVPLPDVAGRNRLITHLMKKQVRWGDLGLH